LIQGRKRKVGEREQERTLIGEGLGKAAEKRKRGRRSGFKVGDEGRRTTEEPGTAFRFIKEKGEERRRHLRKGGRVSVGKKMLSC